MHRRIEGSVAGADLELANWRIAQFDDRARRDERLLEAAAEPFRATTASVSELKVNRQLQLPWNDRLVRSREYRNG